ncbi:hypothetical protein BH23CHL8_BH23CHL8_29550 [soil metagenome]
MSKITTGHPDDTSPPFASLARRSARQQRRAIEAGDAALAAIFARVTAAMVDAHLKSIRP